MGQGGDPAAMLNAANVVCMEPECVSMMQEQVQQCSEAQDFYTAAGVQMFVTILGTCEQVNGAVDAVTSATCSEQQMASLMSTCYLDNAHTQPNCGACLPMLGAMINSCPGSFLAGPAAELNAQCAQAIAVECPNMAAGVTATCCDEPTEDCTSGMPASCNEGCAQVFIPFMNSCSSMLGDQAVMLGGLLSQCEAACPTCATGGGK